MSIRKSDRWSVAVATRLEGETQKILSDAGKMPRCRQKDALSSTGTEGQDMLPTLKETNACRRPPLRRNFEEEELVGIVAMSGDGKTSLIEHLIISGIPDITYYNSQKMELHRTEDLEATCLARQACDDLDSDYSADKIIHYTKPELYTSSPKGKVEMIESIDWLKGTLDFSKGYKLTKEFWFQSLDLIAPAGNQGSVGTTIPLRVASGSEPQVLWQIMTLDQIQAPLLNHLMVVSGRAEDLLDDKDKEKYCCHIKELWRLLIDNHACMEEQVQLWDKQGSKYQLPLKPWVAEMAGQQLVFRSRRPDNKADFLAELLFVSDVLKVCQPPAQGPFNLTSEQEQLLEALKEQRASGPWEAILNLRESQAELKSFREGLLSITQEIAVFVPNTLLGHMNLVIMDSVGFDDANPTRMVRQRKLEERLHSMILLLPRCLDSNQTIIEYLGDSTFIQRFLHDENPRPRLTAVQFIEKGGMQPPPRSRDGSVINLPWIIKNGKHLQNNLDATLPLTRSKIEEVLVENLREHPDAERLAAERVNDVCVMHSLPMLGISVLQAAIEERIPDDSAVIEEVVQRCSLVDFMSILSSPMVDRCTEVLTGALDLLTEVNEPNANALQSYEWVDRVASNSILRKDLDKKNLKGVHSTEKLKLLDSQVGPDSLFAKELHDKLNVKLWNATETRLLDSVSDLEKEVGFRMKNISSKMIAKFCGGRRGKLSQLLTTLQPVHEWRHKDAPLMGWLRAELRTMDLSFILKTLQEELLPEVISAVLDVMASTIIKYVIPEGQGITEDMVKDVLRDCFDLTGQVKRVFQLAFNKHNGAVNKYKKLLVGEVVDMSANRIRRTDIYNRVKGVLDDSNLNHQSERKEEIERVLSSWFEDSTFEILKNIKHVLILRLSKGGSKGSVGSFVYEQWKDAKRRLYLAAFDKSGGGVSSITPKHTSLLIPTYRAFARVMANELTHVQEENDNLKVQQRLLALPQEILDGCDPYIKCLLCKPMGIVYDQALIHLGPSPMVVEPATSQPAPSPTVVKLGTDQQALSPVMPDGWLNGGLGATRDNMKNLVQHLESQGLRLLDVPGVDNNCAYRAVLCQHFGNEDLEEAAQAAQAREFRAKVLTFLENVIADELKDESTYDISVWTRHIQTLQGREAYANARGNVNEYLSGIQNGNMSTDVDISALVIILDLDSRNSALELYSPLYDNSRGFHMTLTKTKASDAQKVIRIAWVPAGGAGELNHFQVVEPKTTDTKDSNEGPRKRMRR